MQSQLFNQPHYLIECIALLADHANGDTYEALIADICKKHSLPEESIAPLFQSQIRLRDRVLTELCGDAQRLAHMFKRMGENSYGQDCLASLIFSISPQTDAEVYAEELLSLSEDGQRQHITQEILGYLEESVVTSEDVETYFTPGALERHILESSASDTEKVALMGLCVSFAANVRELTPLLTKAVSLFKENESLVLPQFREQLAKLEEKIKQDGPNVLARYINLPEDEDGTLYIIPSIVQSNSARYVARNTPQKRDNDQFILYGVNLDTILDLRNSKKGQEKSIADILKILGDKTKQDILYALRHESLYGQALAEKLGLSTPTISYHMNLLLHHDFIHVSRESTRLYYSLNKEALAKSLEQIRAYFCE